MSLRSAAEAVRNGEVDLGVTDSRTLQELTREGASLAARDLGEMGYALFVPKRLKASTGQELPLEAMRRLPLALQHSEKVVGDRVRELLGTGPRRRSGIECETFPQAARAVLAGTHAAVLPDIAHTELPRSSFSRIDIPELHDLRRVLCLAWSSEAAAVTPGLKSTAEMLAKALRLSA